MASLFDGLPPTEPSHHNGFAGNRIDRRSEKRSEDAIAIALSDQRARFYLFHADKALLRGNDPLFLVREADGFGRGDPVLLGWTGDGPRLAAVIAETTPIDDPRLTSTDLRSLAVEGAVALEHLGALAQGRSLCNWHGRHRFCANCGAETAIRIGGYRRDCPTRTRRSANPVH